MSTITEYYNQAELALAAYANLNSYMTDSEYIDALQDDGDGMSLSQATAFAAKWEVEDSFSDDTGVSATVFKRRNDASGQTYLAIRGTDSPGDFDDLFILAGSALPHLNPQFLQLRLKIIEWLDDGKLTSGFTVAGHSLGGYLAVAAGTWFNADSAEMYTFNAPGIGGLIGNATDAFLVELGSHLD